MAKHSTYPHRDYSHFSVRLMERYGLFITEDNWKKLFSEKGKLVKQSENTLVELIKLMDKKVVVVKCLRRRCAVTVMPLGWYMGKKK